MELIKGSLHLYIYHIWVRVRFSSLWDYMALSHEAQTAPPFPANVICGQPSINRNLTSNCGLNEWAFYISYLYLEWYDLLRECYIRITKRTIVVSLKISKDHNINKTMLWYHDMQIMTLGVSNHDDSMVTSWVQRHINTRQWTAWQNLTTNSPLS